ncbi:MAG: hypothetical protein ABIH34_00960 [Nanoarchaeota archaeon]
MGYMKAYQIFFLAQVFLLGFLAHMVLTELNTPIQTQLAQPRLVTTSPERMSPHDWIQEKDIRLTSDSVIISVEKPILAAFEGTNSMDPFLDETANAIEIVPKDPSEIHVGDVVSYETEYGPVIHRVIETGVDDDGWYARFKGDNNPYEDQGKIRFREINRVLVAVIY